MPLSWRARRQFLYYAFGTLILCGALYLGWQSFFAAAPSCFDHKQNGGELGVDCGGPCARICEAQARQPIVLWTRALQTAPGLYTAAAVIENPNNAQQAGAYGVHYAFRLLDANNLLVTERDGVIDLPPQQDVPIIEPNISVGTRVVARAFFEFSDSSIVWQTFKAQDLPSIALTKQELSPDGSRLSVEVMNQGNAPVKDLVLAGILYDGSDSAQAASRTLVPAIAPGSSQEAVFTWPGGVANTVRAQILPLLPLPPR